MLATTAYDSPDASYTYSISRSREALHEAWLPTAYLLLQGNCHVDDARNTVVREFLNSDCADLVFLDADVSWEPEHLVQLCQYDCDVVGGVYPFRRDAEATMPVRSLAGVYEPDESGLLEVEALPTGFLRIRRHVLEAMAKQAKSFTKDGSTPIPLIFERDILNGGRRGGDIRFGMRWRDMGGKCYAAANLRLGHAGKQVITDSLAASLRRQLGTSLKHVAEQIRDESETQDTFDEAVKACGNNWSLKADGLAAAVILARKSRGPILEMGSGLSTILMASATDQVVWCVEHSPMYALRLKEMAREAGLKNIALVTVTMKDDWYDLSEDMNTLPSKFALGLLDGPPRIFGTRTRFFDVFGDRCSVILCDDADDPSYANKIKDWADSKGRPVEFGDHRSAVILQANG